MKKLYMTILICVTVGCVVGGTLTHALRLAAYAGKYANFSGHAGDSSRTVSSADVTAAEDYDLAPFTHLMIDVGMGNVTLIPGTGYHLFYTGAEALVPTVDEESGVTAIHQANGNWRSLFDTDNPFGVRNTLMITFPPDAKLSELVATLDMGDFTIDGVTAQNANIELNMGNLDLQNATFAGLTVKNSLGNVTVTDVAADVADFSDSMGNIDIKRLNGFTSLILDADMGNVDVLLSQRLSDLALDLNADLGSIYINGEKSASHTTRGEGELKVSADASMGTIRITTAK